MSQIELELKGGKTVLVDPVEVTGMWPSYDAAHQVYWTDVAYWEQGARHILKTTTPWSEAVARIWLAKAPVLP